MLERRLSPTAMVEHTIFDRASFLDFVKQNTLFLSNEEYKSRVDPDYVFTYYNLRLDLSDRSIEEISVYVNTDSFAINGRSYLHTLPSFIVHEGIEMWNLIKMGMHLMPADLSQLDDCRNTSHKLAMRAQMRFAKQNSYLDDLIYLLTGHPLIKELDRELANEHIEIYNRIVKRRWFTMTDSPDTGRYKPENEEVIIEGAVKIRRRADVLDEDGEVVGKTLYTTEAPRDSGEGYNPSDN